MLVGGGCKKELLKVFTGLVVVLLTVLVRAQGSSACQHYY